MSNFTELHLTHEIFRYFTRVITILVKFDIQFSRTSMRNFLWCHIAMILKVQHYSSKLLDRMFTPHDS